MTQTLEQEVNKPTHYNSHESGIEPITVTRWMDFSSGNCLKYLMRYRHKGTPKKDLMKCEFYLNDFLAHKIDENNQLVGWHEDREMLLDLAFIVVGEVNPEVALVIKFLLAVYRDGGIVSVEQKNEALSTLKKLIEEN